MGVLELTDAKSQRGTMADTYQILHAKGKNLTRRLELVYRLIAT